jgi:hypothetical protein
MASFPDPPALVVAEMDQSLVPPDDCWLQQEGRELLALNVSEIGKEL